MHCLHELLQALQSCNDNFDKESKILDEKVASLQCFINQLNLALESMPNERKCAEVRNAAEDATMRESVNLTN